MIYILLVVAGLLTLLSFWINKRDYIAPSFVFCATFTFAIAWAAAFAERWQFELHMNTFWVIAGGMLVFVLVAAIVQWVTNVFRGKQKLRARQQPSYIEVEVEKKVVALTIEVISIVATVYSILQVMSAGLTNIMGTITQYREAGLFGGEAMEALPGWIGVIRLVAIAIGYWFLYVTINNFMLKKRDWLSLVIVILSVLSSMATGSRGDAFFMLISGIAIFFVLKNKQGSFRKAVKFKTLLLIILIGVVVLFTFRWTAELVGRTAGFELADYIAIYCGAEIMNLDTFLQTSHSPSRIWGGQTFINLLPRMSQIFGFDAENYALDLPFRYANGNFMGNVYTTFYPYIYDFGYVGVVVMVGLMAFLMQWNYERVKRVSLSRARKVPMCMLIFEYMIPTAFFSFFSNKFYEYMANEAFLRVIIVWILWNCIQRQIRFKKMKVRR